MRTTTAVLAGAVLFTLPFQLYLHGETHHADRSAAHADHDARHGGMLVMVEDHHLEIVVSDGRVEVFVTDALRKPVRPAGGSVVFDDGTTANLAWQSHRLTAAAPPHFAWADYEVRLEGGAALAIRVPRASDDRRSLKDPG
jgi:hypothetical protein